MPTPLKTPDQAKIDAEAAEAARIAGDKPLADNDPAAIFLKSVIGDKPAKPEPKPKPEGGEGDGDEGDQKPKPKKKAAAPPTPPPAVIDEEKLGASIGKSIAEATAAAKKADEKPDPKATVEDKADARRLAVLQRMESMNSERYAGLADRYKENKSKLKAYAAEWEAANPGEKFDTNADEHSDFVDGLESQIDYDDDDYTQALFEIRLDAKAGEKEKALDERVANVERVERARKEAPKIQAAGVAAGNEYWKSMGDDFKEVVDDEGKLNAEALSAIAAADPVKHEIAIAAADAVERTAATIYMLANDLTTFDPKNETHVGLARFSLSEEEKMMQRPAAKRVDEEGRPFATKRDYDTMTPAQRSKHWTFSPDDLIYLATHSIIKRSKADLEAEDAKFTKRARARGLIQDEEKPTPATTRRGSGRIQDNDDDNEGDEGSGSDKPVSPSISSSPKLAVGKGVKFDNEKSAAVRFVTKLIG